MLKLWGEGDTQSVESGGWGLEVQQTFVLSDWIFSPVLPCNSGECFKIIRIEEGGLGELVTVWLEVTAGMALPAGSIGVIFSASHLHMEGLEGYLHDLLGEFSRIV